MADDEDINPTILVVFGISGDLSRRYSLPALVQIKKTGLLPADFKLIGISRREITEDEIITNNLRSLKPYFELMKMDLEHRADYMALKQKLDDVRKSFRRDPQIIFYLVVPPEAVSAIVKNLGQTRLNGERIKLMLEKPLGSDLASASKLTATIKRYFKEDQLFHIDHYLAKEVAQNISVFLGSNALFRGIWNNRFIERVEILASESIGAEERGFFYEQTGALRDLVQSHLLQLAALVLTEPSADVFDIERLPPGRLTALRSIRKPKEKELEDITAGQYKKYPELVGNTESSIETFVDLTLYSNNPRWRGVPIRLTTGKKMGGKRTEIKVYFKRSHDSQSNLLCIRIQPKESIELDLWVKEPGLRRKLKKLTHSFDYGYHFGKLPDAYEQVLVDALRGSHGLFATTAEVLASWRIIQPILDHWQAGNKKLKIYEPGSTLEEILKA